MRPSAAVGSGQLSRWAVPPISSSRKRVVQASNNSCMNEQLLGLAPPPIPHYPIRSSSSTTHFRNPAGILRGGIFEGG